MNHTKGLAPAQTDEWLTPLPIVQALGVFDLDPAAPADAKWPTAGRQFTRLDDGLKQVWSGRVWLNPPYSRADLWMERMAAHDHGTALVFARTETDWFNFSVWNCAAAVLFIKRRVRFHSLIGRKMADAPCPSVLAAYGDGDAGILYGCAIEGKFIALRLRIEVRTTWRRLIRFLIKQAGGVCTLEELYAVVADHPKAASRPNWKAKVRQQVQREARRVGPACWQLMFPEEVTQ